MLFVYLFVLFLGVIVECGWRGCPHKKPCVELSQLKIFHPVLKRVEAICLHPLKHRTQKFMFVSISWLHPMIQRCIFCQVLPPVSLWHQILRLEPYVQIIVFEAPPVVHIGAPVYSFHVAASYPQHAADVRRIVEPMKWLFTAVDDEMSGFDVTAVQIAIVARHEISVVNDETREVPQALALHVPHVEQQTPVERIVL